MEEMMTASERVAMLASFFSCSLEEAGKVDAATRLVHYRHKDILVHQGDLGAKLWIVLAGRAQLQIIGMDGQTKLLASHGPGELFGAFPNERIVISDVVVQNRLSVLEIAGAPAPCSRLISSSSFDTTIHSTFNQSWRLFRS